MNRDCLPSWWRDTASGVVSVDGWRVYEGDDGLWHVARWGVDMRTGGRRRRRAWWRSFDHAYYAAEAYRKRDEGR